MKYFTTKEMCASWRAEEAGIPNIPNEEQKKLMVTFIEKVLDVIRSEWGAPIIVNSGFRNIQLNTLVKGAKNSEHLYLNGSAAADIRAKNIKDNKRLFELIRRLANEGKITFRQLISENTTNGNPEWVHISYKEGDNKQQIIIA